MSNSVIQTDIKAFDEFSQAFNKFQSELRRTNTEQQQTAQGADKMNKSVSLFFQTIGSLGALYAFQRGLSNVIGTSMDFEVSMSKVKAISGAVGKGFDSLQTKAVQLGAATVFSASQAAEGMSYLAMAGYEVDEILSTMPGMLSIAAAGAVDLGTASDITSNILSGFGIAAEDTGHVVDVLAKTFTSSNTTLEKLGYTMKYVAPIANSAGLSLEEMAAAAGELGNVGIQGEMAGTQLRAMITRLVDPPAEAAKALEALNVEVMDMNGNLLPLADVLEQITQSTEGYTAAQKTQIAAQIAGTEAAAGFAALIDAGPDALRDYTDELTNSTGAADELANTMQENLKGAITELAGAVETAKIELGDEFAPAVYMVVDALQTLTLGFNSLSEEGKQYVAFLIGGSGLVVALGATVTAINAVTTAAAAMGVTVSVAAGPIGIAVAAVVALTGATIAYKGSVEQAKRAEQERINTLENQVRKLPELVSEYGKLTDKIDKTEAEEQQLKAITEELTGIMPEAIQGFNEYGDAIYNTGELAEQARVKIANMKAEIVDYYQRKSSMAMVELPQLEEQRKGLEEEYQKWQKQLEINASDVGDITIFGRTFNNPLAGEMGDSDYVLGKLKDYDEQLSDIDLQILEYKQAVDVYQSIATGTDTRSNELKEYTKTGAWSKSTKTTNTANNAPSGGGSNATTDLTSQAIQTVTDALTPYQAAVEAAANSVALLGAKEQYLTELMEAGGATTEQVMELLWTRQQQLSVISIQQTKIKEQAEAEAEAYAMLKEQYEAATDPDDARALQEEMSRLANSVASAEQEFWNLERQRLQVEEELEQFEEQRYNDGYQRAMDLMRHEVNMARMSTEQQIEYLQKLRDAYSWSNSQKWEIEEQLYSLRRSQLYSYLDELDEEYQDSLDAIDRRTKASIRSIQADIDTLDAEGKTTDREEAERQHNERLAELHEERQYHELRTGKEHQEAIADLDEQIAEEKREWEIKQQEWARDDRRDALQEKLEEVEEEAEEERNLLEDHYQKARDIAEDGILDTIAAMAATSPEWMETGEKLIDALIRGLESGDFSTVQSMIDNIRQQADTYYSSSGSYSSYDPNDYMPASLPESTRQLIATIAPSQVKNIGGSYYMQSRSLAAILGESVSWDQATGRVEIGGQWFTPGLNDNGTTYVGIRQVAESLGYEVEYVPQSDSVNIYRAATGGLFTSPALSWIAEAGESEVALPLSKFQPMMNEAVYEALSSAYSIDLLDTMRMGTGVAPQYGAGSGITINFYGPVMAPEELVISSDMDIRRIGDELRKEIMALSTSRGV